VTRGFAVFGVFCLLQLLVPPIHTVPVTVRRTT
jgi:hypothetical protein